MSDSFTTSKFRLDVKDNFISVGQFIASLFWLDIGMVLAGLILWKFFWYDLNKLKIWDIKYGIEVTIGKDTPIWRVIKCLHKAVKNLSSLNHNYFMETCGFEAFSFLFFQKRFAHLMFVLTITDFCVLIPYELYFNQTAQFSLVSLDSGSNSIFRTFYTLWVTVAVLYNIQQMKRYLRLVLKNRLLRVDKRLLNNLKSKTVLVHFSGEQRRIDAIELKTRLIEKLKIEDTIIASIQIENNLRKYEIEYQYQIYKIVKELGMDYFHPIWKFFKGIKGDPEQYVKKRIQVALQRADKDSPFLNSYLVTFQNMDTSLALVEEFKHTKSIYQIVPETSNRATEVEYHYNQFVDIQISVNWAQQASDIRWICLGTPEKTKKCRYVWMNFLAILLIILGVGFMILSRSKTILNIPDILLPPMLGIINVTLRFLISKSSEWENKHFQYEWHMKEMKILIIFFTINVLVGSIVRDTLNLVDILKSGWGWLEIFGLIYKKPDGYFYYGYIINEVAFTAFAVFFKIGDLFIEVFHSYFTYLKNNLVRHKSRYGTNDPFRYGYFYCLNVVIFAVIFMYSASCPLIHLFGFLYFYSMLYLYGYTLSVYHKSEQTCSNLRLLQTACNYIVMMMVFIIALIGVTMMFQRQYSGALILYFWVPVILWLKWNDEKQPYFLKDYYTDEEIKRQDINGVVREWKRQYSQSMRPLKVPY